MNFESLFISTNTIREKNILITQYIRKYKLSKYIEVDDIDQKLVDVLDYWYYYFSDIIDIYKGNSKTYYDVNTNNLHIHDINYVYTPYIRFIICEIVKELYGLEMLFTFIRFNTGI